MAFKLPKFSFGAKLDAVIILSQDIEKISVQINDVVAGVKDGIGQEDVTLILVLAQHLQDLSISIQKLLK